MFRTVPLSIIRTQLGSRIRTELQFLSDPARKLYDVYHCCVYSEKLLMMVRGTFRNT